MITLSDFNELEKLAENFASAEKDMGIAIEQNFPYELCKNAIEERKQAACKFYNKLYAMRIELIKG